MASHRRPARVTVLTAAAAATAAASLGAVPASADPGAGAARTTVDRLFEEAERATESYNQADEKADALRRTVSRARDGLARGQERVNRMRGVLGAVAGAQYRSGGIDPALALFLSSDPDSYLERASALDRLTAHQSAALGELLREQRRLGQQRSEARTVLAELERSRTEVARHKRTVERKLAEARRVLASLTAEERADFEERASRTGGRGDARAGGPAGETMPAADAGPVSSRVAAAVAAARGAVGRPYVWGRPALRLRLLRPDGLVLPPGRDRPAAHLRRPAVRGPAGAALAGAAGDLVTYRGDASHVAMYVGDGQVIHAPYPGARVRYDPVNMMSHVTVTRV